MILKLQELVTQHSIYHGYSTWKTFWEVNFTLVNINNCGRRNSRKQRDIKNGEKYTTLEISLDRGSLDKMKVTYSEPKDYLGR